MTKAQKKKARRQKGLNSDAKGKVVQTALEPAAKEFAEGSKGAGQALGEAALTAAKTVKVLLSPLKGLVWGYEQIEERFLPEVQRKLEGVPEERRIQPPLLIAGPTVEALRFTGGQPELREMFANLLATTMDTETAKFAHPSFVEIIRQLSPDEARILKHMENQAPVPLLKVSSLSNDGRTESIEFEKSHFCLLGSEVNLQHSELILEYIYNLCRLGLCEIPPKLTISGDGVYKPLENAPEIKEWLTRLNAQEGYKGKTDRECLRLTRFGYRFVQACVSRRDPQS